MVESGFPDERWDCALELLSLAEHARQRWPMAKQDIYAAVRSTHAQPIRELRFTWTCGKQSTPRFIGVVVLAFFCGGGRGCPRARLFGGNASRAIPLLTCTDVNNNSMFILLLVKNMIWKEDFRG